MKTNFFNYSLQILWIVTKYIFLPQERAREWKLEPNIPFILSFVFLSCSLYYSLLSDLLTSFLVLFNNSQTLGMYTNVLFYFCSFFACAGQLDSQASPPPQSHWSYCPNSIPCGWRLMVLPRCCWVQSLYWPTSDPNYKRLLQWATHTCNLSIDSRCHIRRLESPHPPQDNLSFYKHQFNQQRKLIPVGFNVKTLRGNTKWEKLRHPPPKWERHSGLCESPLQCVTATVGEWQTFLFRSDSGWGRPHLAGLEATRNLVLTSRLIGP